MTDSIISKETIKRRARDAFKSGRGRDSHGFNWHADALPTWLEEFDRLARAAQASSASHTAPAGHQRIDLHQAAPC